ncbi:MAG: sporulation protein YqfD [Ruminococcus sp.]|nr:sporulation protein YqfD [Ruminococcus sp.]
MKNQLRGCIKINVRGKNLYQFINAVHERRIGIFQQYVKGDSLSAEIYRSKLKTIKSVADEFDMELKYFEYDTVSAKIIRQRRRFGLIIGALIVIGASLYFSNVVVTIEIQGNETVSSDLILTALSEIGIKEGIPFGQINYIRSENQLQTMLDDISWVGMHRTGHRLVVEITEIIPKPDMLKNRLPCNIVSAYDAEIVGFSVRDGQLMKKIGDYVFAGDMLINGVTSDSTGHVTLHHAMGSITGIYKKSADFQGSFTKERMTATGETEKRRKLKLFGLEIPLYFGKNHYEYSSSEVLERPFSAFGIQLPIVLKTTEYTELSRSETTLSADELRAELMEKIYLYEQNFLDECEILERKITEDENADTLTLTVEYQLKGDICEEKEILIK